MFADSNMEQALFKHLTVIEVWRLAIYVRSYILPRPIKYTVLSPVFATTAHMYAFAAAACDIRMSAGQVYIEPSYPEVHDSMIEIDCFWTAVTDSAIQMFLSTTLT
jgi:hypothetical protein